MISLIKTSLECQQEKIISQCEIYGCPDGTIVRVVHVGPELSDSAKSTVISAPLKGNIFFDQFHFFWRKA